MNKSFKKAFKKYGLNLECLGSFYRDEIRYKTECITNTGVLIDIVVLKIYEENCEHSGCVFFYYGHFSRELYIVQDDVYGTVLELFKRHNVLTRDEMIIKDIIE